MCGFFWVLKKNTPNPETLAALRAAGKGGLEFTASPFARWGGEGFVSSPPQRLLLTRPGVLLWP